MFLHGAVRDDVVPVSKKFMEEVLVVMQNDLAGVVKKDELILRFGGSLHQRLGRARAHDISQSMRQLAKLILEVNKIHCAQASNAVEHIDLNQCISGRYFDVVIQATQQLCGYFDDPCGRPMFHNPSLGLKLGHSLIKCAELKKGFALRCGSTEMSDDAEAFLSLHKSEWTNSISSSSLATLKHRRYNAPRLLPLTSDLVKLKIYQEKMTVDLITDLRRSPTAAIWRRLMETVYTRIVIFNKRRCGETAKLLCQPMSTVPNGKQLPMTSCKIRCFHWNKSCFKEGRF
jgi:hypothetical protein